MGVSVCTIMLHGSCLISDKRGLINWGRLTKVGLPVCLQQVHFDILVYRMDAIKALWTP